MNDFVLEHKLEDRRIYIFFNMEEHARYLTLMYEEFHVSNDFHAK